jgi:hypothetical protein
MLSIVECDSERVDHPLLLLGVGRGDLFEAFVERLVTKDHAPLLVGLRGFNLRLALGAAELHADAIDVDGGFRVEGTPGERALHLFVLAADHQLLIGLGGELLRVFFEFGRAVVAAEVDLALFVVDGVVLAGRLARNRALQSRGVSSLSNAQTNGHTSDRTQNCRLQHDLDPFNSTGESHVGHFARHAMNQ